MSFTPTHQTETAGWHPVGVAQTRARAGTLLEQGAAFTQLEGATLSPSSGLAEVRDELAPREERFDVVVIGGGHSGLSVGYFLACERVKFVILEARDRVGDTWRRRWDSLRLFTPARYDALAGMPFPAKPHYFPTKDEVADYLEAYAAKFALPVRTGVEVDMVTRADGRYVVTAGTTRYVADHVVVAASGYQKPRIPQFAAALDPAIRQFHSVEYRNPAQLKPGSVLLVGAGNSGAELSLDLAKSHQVWLAGRHPGHIPFVHNSFLATRFVVPVLFRGIFHRLLSVDTPLGRKARPAALAHGGPLIRVKPKDLEAAGVRRVPRVAGVRDGKPLLDDDRTVDVTNVIWCTGFLPGLDWIRLPILDPSGRPEQYRGVAAREPGLYFCGLHFQHSLSSTMVHGAARDARRVVSKIIQRMRAVPHSREAGGRCAGGSDAITVAAADR